MPVEGALGDAHFIIKAALQEYGLGELADWAWQLHGEGVPFEQIMLDLRERPEYLARFPAMRALADKGRAISEAEYISIERAYTQSARARGLPAGFYDDPSDHAERIAGEMSPQEFDNRLDLWEEQSFRRPQEDRDEFLRYYGTEGDFLALTIDPDRALPIIRKQVRASQYSGTAIRSGYGELSQTEAEQIYAFGEPEPGQTAEQFGALVASEEIFTPLERGETAITREEQFAAVFGEDEIARQRIERQGRRRVTPFEGGGGYSGGVGGLSRPGR